MSADGIAPQRLEALILARLTVHAGGLAADALAKQLGRYTPPRLDASAWRSAVEAALAALHAAGAIGDDGALRDHDAFARRVGKSSARTWAAMTDRVLPALALGVAPDDVKRLGRLTGRDAWAAAIVARALGMWTNGPPPSLSAVCDAFVWRQLGLAGKAKRVPAEIRALFMQRELATEPGAPDRLLRLFAAREVGAPRADLRALRAALVRRWLAGGAFGAATPAASTGAPQGEQFASAVREVASAASAGVFGDRKVFIASIWRDLCARPGWNGLTLEDFKLNLLHAHRRGALVLARADLVAAMDPALVAASETRTDGASFHFVVREAS
jgi:hypothetical protein